ncbi:hypothetical protein [Sphingobacterium sp. SYP-B4668]|uniref:hypothetical protein n=1 Tax=Sphingobacterium sp. SYP-B4668 TaxID=2996035 RepID=UPI0022DCE96C|nr:hypothetical protein [Sphingobacterium sp. SYP-B4668]
MTLAQEEEKLNNLIGADLQVDITERVKNFTLLWNIYETFACNRSANSTAISNNVDCIENAKNIDIRKIEIFKLYFLSRYFNKDKAPNNRFLDLVKNDSRIAELIVNELPKNIIDKNTLKALLFIVYRYRNNLFHGNKNVVTLDSQIDNFTYANELLITVLEMMSDRGLLLHPIKQP